MFGYVIEGELEFELEGAPSRVINAGEAFWEPGVDVIHRRAANASADATCRFVVVMLGSPGQPMLVPVVERELGGRSDRGVPGLAAPSDEG